MRCCDVNCLLLNVARTKELVVDFSRSRSQPFPVCNGATDVEIFTSYKYLGVQLDRKLEWSGNMDAVYKKGLTFYEGSDSPMYAAGCFICFISLLL